MVKGGQYKSEWEAVEGINNKGAWKFHIQTYYL